jgi:hypothetical protein
MLVLHGYIDDSGKGNTFILSCLQAEIGMWTFVELAWLEMLEKVNANLRKRGRQEISRYHAADCNGLFNEFKGWTTGEQIELSKMMLDIFKRHLFHINAYSLDLKHLVEEIPETRPNPKGFAYVFLFHMLMLEICDSTLAKFKDSIIGLTHDHCDYDAALLEAFNQMLDDPLFKCRHRFTALMPARWEHCIPLQPADLMAYENFKEALRRKEMSRRQRRTTLRLILDHNPKTMGGNLKCLNRANLRHFKKILDEMNDETKALLLRTARIRTTRLDDAATGSHVDRNNASYQVEN